MMQGALQCTIAQVGQVSQPLSVFLSGISQNEDLWDLVFGKSSCGICLSVPSCLVFVLLHLLCR